jgi:sugar/nucleoside kinase (ribokinase family)
VLKGLASLAACGELAVSFVGMVGADQVGREYRRSIAVHGVTPLLLESASGAATATCLCLVTPDGQRTMRTALCAALELASPQQLPSQLSSGDGGALALLHCEGYCLYRSAVAAAAMRAARARCARVSLDLASFEVVARCWRQLGDLLAERLVDVVFCNEQEAAALCRVRSHALARH